MSKLDDFDFLSDFNIFTKFPIQYEFMLCICFKVPSILVENPVFHRHIYEYMRILANIQIVQIEIWLQNTSNWVLF